MVVSLHKVPLHKVSLHKAQHKAQRLIGVFIIIAGLALAATPSSAENRQDEQELYNQLTLFGDVLEQVRRNYVDAPSDKELIEAALSGMMA